jgi:hypothetical protein
LRLNKVLVRVRHANIREHIIAAFSVHVLISSPGFLSQTILCKGLVGQAIVPAAAF